MNGMLEYLMEMNVTITFVYIVYCLLLKRDTHFQWRRAFLLAGVTVAVVFPVVDFGALSAEFSERVSTYVIPAMSVVAVTASPAEAVGDGAFDLSSLLWTLYCAVALVLSLVLVVRLSGVLRLAGRYSHVWVGDRRLFVMPGNSGAFSFFGLVFVSEAFLDDDNVLSHEAVHVDQCHSIDVLVSEFLAIACWFNPVAWLLRREIRDNLEYIADSRVMTRDNRRDYQLSLLAMTDNQAIAKFYNNFNVSSLKKRIKMMNRKKTSSVALVRYMIVLPAVMALAFISSNWANSAETPVAAPDELAAVAEDEIPQFPGGMREFQTFMMKNLRYPAEAMEANEQGTVEIQMCINADGSVSDLKVIKSVSPSLDAEALRLLSKSPKWEPLKKAKTAYVLVPVSYKLSWGDEDKTTDKAAADTVPSVPNTVVMGYKQK